MNGKESQNNFEIISAEKTSDTNTNYFLVKRRRYLINNTKSNITVTGNTRWVILYQVIYFMSESFQLYDTKIEADVL